MRAPWLPRTRFAIGRRRWLTLVVPVTVGLVAVGFGAAAYWTHDGSGTGAGHIATMANPTIAVAAEATSLYPGGTADLTITVTNANPFPVVLATVEVDPGGVTTQTNGCDAATAISIVPGTLSTTPIAANDSAQFTLTHAAQMSTSASQACQGATFTVPLKVTVKR